MNISLQVGLKSAKLLQSLVHIFKVGIYLGYLGT